MLETVAATANKPDGRLEGRDDSNASPNFIVVNRYPQTRYENIAGVYVNLKPGFAKTTQALRSAQLSEGMDILPAHLALTYPLAVAIGRRVTGLVRDDSPEVDLGSAL